MADSAQPAEIPPVHGYVAIGDSFTEGLEDDLGPGGRHRGWADRVAAALAVGDGGVRYANLAGRGRLLDAVIGEQVPVAAALAPDLVSFQAGGNDVLRPRVDLPRRPGPVRARRRAVAGLRRGGAAVHVRRPPGSRAAPPPGRRAARRRARLVARAAPGARGDRPARGPGGRRPLVRLHFLPWVSRRLRGVSSGDGLSPKHPELVEVLPPAP